MEAIVRSSINWSIFFISLSIVTSLSNNVSDLRVFYIVLFIWLTFALSFYQFPSLPFAFFNFSNVYSCWVSNYVRRSIPLSNAISSSLHSPDVNISSHSLILCSISSDSCLIVDVIDVTLSSSGWLIAAISFSSWSDLISS